MTLQSQLLTTCRVFSPKLVTVCQDLRVRTRRWRKSITGLVLSHNGSVKSKFIFSSRRESHEFRSFDTWHPLLSTFVSRFEMKEVCFLIIWWTYPVKSILHIMHPFIRVVYWTLHLLYTALYWGIIYIYIKIVTWWRKGKQILGFLFIPTCVIDKILANQLNSW